MVWGLSSAGVDISTGRRASLLRKTRDVALARVNKTDLRKAAIVPDGWHFEQRKNQMAPELPQSGPPPLVSGGCTDLFQSPPPGTLKGRAPPYSLRYGSNYRFTSLELYPRRMKIASGMLGPPPHFRCSLC